MTSLRLPLPPVKVNVDEMDDTIRCDVNEAISKNDHNNG